MIVIGQSWCSQWKRLPRFPLRLNRLMPSWFPLHSINLVFITNFSDNSISIYFSEYIVNLNAKINSFFVRHSFNF